MMRLHIGLTILVYLWLAQKLQCAPPGLKPPSNKNKVPSIMQGKKDPIISAQGGVVLLSKPAPLVPGTKPVQLPQPPPTKRTVQTNRESGNVKNSRTMNSNPSSASLLPAGGTPQPSTFLASSRETVPPPQTPKPLPFLSPTQKSQPQTVSQVTKQQKRSNQASSLPDMHTQHPMLNAGALEIPVCIAETITGKDKKVTAANSQYVCALKISEVYSEDKTGQFIELERFCKNDYQQTSYLSLNGYAIILLNLEPLPSIQLVATLDGEMLSEKTHVNTKRYFYLIGSEKIPGVGLSFGTVPHGQNIPKLQYANIPSKSGVLPVENSTPTAVLLLYLPAKQKENILSILELPKSLSGGNEKFTSALPLTITVKNVIRGKIVNSLVYGSASSELSEEILRNLLSNDEFVPENELISLRKSPGEILKPMSYSKCSSVFDNDGTNEITNPTPMAANDCSGKFSKPPYQISGWEVHETGKKMILNLLHQLKTNPPNSNIYIGSPTTVAARLLGVNFMLVYRTQRDGESCFVREKREHKKYKQCEVDSFDRDVIRTIISDSYKTGKAPIFKEIYNSFLDYKRNGFVSYTTTSSMTNGNQFLPLCTKLTENGEGKRLTSTFIDTSDRETHVVQAQPYTGSSTTFARVLHDMGFKYGVVDKRVCLMQRTDLFTWRRMFIKAISDNEKSPQRKKVTYLDKTWVDPHNKWSKGWTLRNPENSRECLKYSFQDIKISSGPRLVIIAAGDDDGIIPESVKVRKIDAKDVAGDYHRNVNAIEFIQWFKDLLDIFDKRNEKHLIVIDNAPYHSTQEAPKRSDKKAVLISWLTEKSKNPRLKIPDITGMKKDQLWTEVVKIKDNPTFAEEIYELDRIAAARGHKILRLPPYHCVFNPIEGTWNDVKTLVAKLNTNQNVNDVLKLVENALKTYSPDTWKRHVGHCRKLMDKYWKEDGHQEVNVQPLIIPLFEDEEESEDEFEDMEIDDENDIEVDCVNDQYEFDPLEIEEDLRLGRIEVENFHRQNNSTKEKAVFKFPGRRNRKRRFVDLDWS